jgi:MFS family permease
VKITSRTAGVSAQVVALLAIIACINYADRGTLATAAPLLKDELGLSNASMGVLLSAFFWSYSPACLLAGWFAQRFDARRVLAAGVAIWAIATVLTGFVSGFIALLGLRLALGLGESVMFPCNSQILAQEAQELERGRANGFIVSGMALGPSVGTLLGGLLMARFGWRTGFFVFGAVSLLWLWPWLRAPRPAPTATAIAAEFTHDRTSSVAIAAGPSFAKILKQRALWGASLGQFCTNYVVALMLAWLPSYLVKERGYSVASMAQIGAIIYAFYAISSALVGWQSDRWIRAGIAPTLVRKGFIMSAAAGIAIAMLICGFAGPKLSLFLLGFSALCFGMQTPMHFSIGQTLAGPTAAGKWMGVQNFLGNLSGILAPILTGEVIDKTGSYLWAFIIAAGFSLLAIVAWGLIVGRVEPLRWGSQRI